MDIKNGDVRTFIFVLIPDFSMLAFAAAIDPLRVANRQIGRRVYNWRVISVDGNPIRASNGLEIQVSGSIADERRKMFSLEKIDFVVVCSGIRVEKFLSKDLNNWLRTIVNRNIPLAAVCTGAWVLAGAGILDGKRCAIHWENLPAFSEAFPEVNVYADLFEIDSNIYTCSGGTAPLDMMMYIIADHHGEVVVNRVCEQALADRIRNPHDRQRLPLRARLGIQNTKLLTIIELMEANISEPLPFSQISKIVQLSRRQIERLFQKNLERSPARYYLEIRLDRARHLLIQSTMPVVEVAVACGFVSASHFSKCYREMYSRSPQMERYAYSIIASE